MAYIKLKDKNFNKVSLVFYNSEQLLILDMELKENIWFINVCNLEKIIYKFLIDEKYLINDPNADNYILIENSGYWSCIKNKQKNKLNQIIIENITVCKRLTDEYDPLFSCLSINQYDENIICWLNLRNINSDFIVTMVWEMPSGIIFNTIDIFIKYDNRNNRKVYSGIKISDIISLPEIEEGKWNIKIFINGGIDRIISFNLIKNNDYTKLIKKFNR
jgi:hypothetical protein